MRLCVTLARRTGHACHVMILLLATAGAIDRDHLAGSAPKSDWPSTRCDHNTHSGGHEPVTRILLALPRVQRAMLLLPVPDCSRRDAAAESPSDRRAPNHESHNRLPGSALSDGLRLGPPFWRRACLRQAFSRTWAVPAERKESPLGSGLAGKMPAPRCGQIPRTDKRQALSHGVYFLAASCFANRIDIAFFSPVPSFM